MKKFIFLFFVFGIFSLLFMSCNTNCNKISGTYSGTCEQGGNPGTGKLIINSDCSATLTYDYGDYGRETEEGNIIKKGTSGIGYEFRTKDGQGVYELQIDNNVATIEGFHWHCVLGK
ncbi:MAG: hypothetical protein ABSD71_14255 [Bacteroidales bacterium]|jgi:hypothetical protein